MNSFRVLVFAPLLVSCIGMFVGGGGRRIGVVSKRDAPTVDDVLKIIRKTLTEAHKGIEGTALAEAMNEIISLVEQLTEGQEVDDQAVQDLINETSKAVESVSVVSILFNDPLARRGDELAVALALLQELAKKTEELEKAGESVVTALVAIAETAGKICDIVDDSASIIEYIFEKKKFTKRGGDWSVDLGGVHYNNGGFSATATPTFDGGFGGKVSFTWRFRK